MLPLKLLIYNLVLLVLNPTDDHEGSFLNKNPVC